MPAKTATNNIDRLADEHTETLLAVEDVLDKLVKDEDLTLNESLIFERLRWDRATVERQVRRLATVRRLQNEAGTAEDRQVALDRAKAAERQADESLPALREQVAEAQREIARLESEARSRWQLVEHLDGICEKLRKPSALPEHVIAGHRHMIEQRVNPIDAKINRAKARIEHIRILASLNPDSSEHVAIIRRTAHETKGGHPWNVDEIVNGRTRESVDRRVWGEYVDTLASELPDLEQQVAELEEQSAQVRSEVDRMLDHYISD